MVLVLIDAHLFRWLRMICYVSAGLDARHLFKQPIDEITGTIQPLGSYMDVVDNVDQVQHSL